MNLRTSATLGLFFIVNMALANPFLPRFAVQKSGNDVLVYWSTSGGFTCEDLSVEFGTDTAKMEVVYRYPGICGSESAEMSYQFLHKDVPKNRRLYYRINLGIFGVSAPVFTKLIEAEAGFKVLPHPAHTGSILLIESKPYEEVHIQVYNLEGLLLHEISGTGIVEVPVSDLNLMRNGTYIIVLELNGTLRRQLIQFTQH